jgi:hypothetical protein
MGQLSSAWGQQRFGPAIRRRKQNTTRSQTVAAAAAAFKLEHVAGHHNMLTMGLG